MTNAKVTQFLMIYKICKHDLQAEVCSFCGLQFRYLILAPRGIVFVVS